MTISETQIYVKLSMPQSFT